MKIMKLIITILLFVLFSCGPKNEPKLVFTVEVTFSNSDIDTVLVYTRYGKPQLMNGGCMYVNNPKNTHEKLCHIRSFRVLDEKRL